MWSSRLAGQPFALWEIEMRMAPWMRDLGFDGEEVISPRVAEHKSLMI